MKHARKKTLEDIDFILAHVDIDFESQAVWGDEIQVTAWPSKIGNSSFTLSYEISEKRSGRVLARAKSVQVSYDYERRKDRKSTRLNSSHTVISYAVFCLKKKKKEITQAL